MTVNNIKKKKIAITGGIASGKSTVSAIISELGFRVYSADKIYAELLKEREVVLKCSDILGIKPLIVDGNPVFDRKTASAVVFENEEKRKALNEYTHELIYKRIDEIYSNENGVTFFEIPLLFESGRQDLFDDVIVVLRDKRKRVESVCKRDKKDKDSVLKIMSAQFDYDNFDSSAYTVIYNDKDKATLAERVKSYFKNI